MGATIGNYCGKEGQADTSIHSLLIGHKKKLNYKRHESVLKEILLYMYIINLRNLVL